MRSGMFVSTLFGVAGFIGFGLWGALRCSLFWIGHPFNCGWVFILMGVVGYLAGLAASIVVFRLVKAVMHVVLLPALNLVRRRAKTQDTPVE